MTLMLEKAPVVQQATIHWQWIFLAQSEWGNEIMRDVARRWAEANCDKWPVVIEVHEHAGWFLSYLFDQRHQGLLVGTANDRAVFHEPARSARAEIGQMKQIWLPAIHREAEAGSAK